MSGGHFDYQQYYIEDIANSIEKGVSPTFTTYVTV